MGTFEVLKEGGPRMFITISIMDLILYDVQDLLPLVGLHYILNRDISFSFRVLVAFEVKTLPFDILGFYSSQHSHILLSP